MEMSKQKPTCYAGGVKSLYKNHLSVTIELFSHYRKKGKVIFMAKKNNDLAHTKWMCKYHIVFTP